MASKANRKSQSVSDTIANSALVSQEVTMTAQTNSNFVPETNSEADRLAASSDELIAQAIDTPLTAEEQGDVVPSAEAEKVAFNVYRSNQPESKGMIFSILYFNPAHTYPAEGVKDDRVVRLYTNSGPAWREARGWLSTITDYITGKYSEVDSSGLAIRQNGNLVISAKLFNSLASKTRMQGIWTLSGIREEGMTITGFSGIREGQLWLEFKDNGDGIYSFWSAMNGIQVNYYQRLMKLAGGWNVYFRKLDSRARLSPERYMALQQKTKDMYCNNRGEFFFKQPLIEHFCAKMDMSPEEARQFSADHIQASKQKRAISASAYRASEDAKATGEVAQLDNTKLYLRDAKKCSVPAAVKTDDKGAYVLAADLPAARLFGFNAAGIPVVQVTWSKVTPDVEKENQDALRKIQAANGVKWQF